MTGPDTRDDVCEPRWDGRRVLFEVRHEGGDVLCAISPDALCELTSRRCFKAQDALATFATARLRVEAIARNKLGARRAPPVALLTVWSGDIEDYGRTGGPGR